MKSFIQTALPLMLLPLITPAQKLPNVQTAGVYAPAGIKIEGKATEWGDKFKAYNKNIEAFYTIANDDQNLYLTIKAPTHDIASKIIRGGLTLIVNHTIKKNDPAAVSVTFPVLRGGDMAAVANMFTRKSYKQEDGIEVSAKQLNDLFEAKSKIIAVTGITDIPDKEISVYNDYSIKAAALFDDKNAFTYELAIPLKYLNLPVDRADAFSYHVKLNEEPTTLSPNSGGPPPPPVFIGALGTTDFWGVYTLAKK